MDTTSNLIVTCGACGTRNRVPANRMDDKAICGRCGRPLSVKGRVNIKPLEITDRDFIREVAEAKGLVAVYCWASWCGHCKGMTPIVEEMAQEYAGRIKFVKTTMEQSPNLARTYDIQGVPALLFFRGGRLVNRIVGALSKVELQRRLNAMP